MENKQPDGIDTAMSIIVVIVAIVGMIITFSLL